MRCVAQPGNEHHTDTKATKADLLSYLCGEDDILGLQVAMHNVLGVTVVDGAQQLIHELLGVVLGVVPCCNNAIEELAARAELLHQMDELVVLVDLP
jgi:hypothetical protein